MAKKKAQKPRRELTRHQLTRQQQQKRRQRLFLIIGISVIAVVAGVTGGGWYKSEYLPMHETVIRVNDTEFTMGYYVDMLEVQGRVYKQIYGADQAYQYLRPLASQVEQFIEQTELMRQAAADLGIVVSEHEVDEALRESATPLGRDYRELMKHDLLVQKLLDEHFEQEIPVFAEQRHVMAMFLESESQAKGTRARLVEGEDFVTLAGEFSLYDGPSQDGSGDLGWHPKGVLSESFGLSVPEEYAFSAGVGELSQPLYDEARAKDIGYWLVEVLERDEDEQGELFHVQVMLLGSEEEAQEIKAKLEAGEDFATLAKEHSQHEASKEDGGDLGWLTPDDIPENLKDFVLSVEAGTLSEPVRDDTVVTKGGYWLVKVVDKEENRQISDEDRSFLKTKALDEWALSLWDDPENRVESYLDSEKVEWAIDRVMAE